MEEEIWKDVEGYETLYRVSNFGRIISCERTYYLGHHNSSSRYIPENFPKIFLNERGYLCVMMCKGAKQKKKKVHRLVAQHFVPNPENKSEVNHDDGNKLNCRADNLSWMTHLENMRHAVSTSLIPSGVGNHNSKLTQEQAEEIRNSTESTRALAKKYPIGKSAIHRIKKHGAYALN